jgi:hypothetical protein
VVFEHLFPDGLLERKEWTAFFLAIIYSTISIIIARFLFPANSGIVSVIFVSIFLIPYFSTILRREEYQEKREKRKGFLNLLRDNADVIQIYFFIFMGIYLAYMAYSFLAPYFGYEVGVVFREQLSLESVRGGAVFDIGTFTAILLNNWWVLLATFTIALIAGDGAVFFIAWNASAWGTIFGYRAFMAGAHTGESALFMLLIIVLITLPHLILEGGAYILAALSGGIMSDLVDKLDEIRTFVIYFVCAAIFFMLLHKVAGFALGPIGLGVFDLTVALLALYGVGFLLEDSDIHVFQYNYWLFIAAIGVFIIGALVETFVLYNATPLQEVYFAAMS